MSSSVQINMELDPASVKRFRKFTQAMVIEKRRNVVQTINKRVILINRDAKIAAPIVDGTLRAGLGVELAKMSQENPTGQVTNKTPYGGFVNLGTGTRGAASYSGTLPLNYHHGPSKGQKANMYLTKAVDDNRKGFFEDMKKALS